MRMSNDWLSIVSAPTFKLFLSLGGLKGQWHEFSIVYPNKYLQGIKIAMHTYNNLSYWN